MMDNFDFRPKITGSDIGIELQPSVNLPYDTETTPIQRQIERIVTNGRGYLGIQDALNIVNSKSYLPKISLLHIITDGFLPLYFGPPKEFSLKVLNPCNEISLGEPQPFSIYTETSTLLEQLRMRQRVIWMEETRRKHPHAFFRAS